MAPTSPSQPDKPPATSAPAQPWDARNFNAAPTEEQLRALKAQDDAARAQATAPVKSTSVVEAAKTIRPADFLSFHERPCVREGLLPGIGGGLAVGAIRFIVGAPIPKAANWAVGGIVLGSIASFEYCQAKRVAEKEKMKRIVEVYSQQQALKEEEARRKRQAEAEATKVAATQKSWYRFW